MKLLTPSNQSPEGVNADTGSTDGQNLDITTNVAQVTQMLLGWLSSCIILNSIRLDESDAYVELSWIQMQCNSPSTAER